MIRFSSKKVGSRRSPKWAALRKRFLKGKKCAVCLGTKSLELHHIIPYHIDPSRELDESNLIPLCEAHKVCNCHALLGHLGNYSSYNVKVVEDAARWQQRFLSRPTKQTEIK